MLQWFQFINIFKQYHSQNLYYHELEALNVLSGWSANAVECILSSETLYLKQLSINKKIKRFLTKSKGCRDKEICYICTGPQCKPTRN